MNQKNATKTNSQVLVGITQMSCSDLPQKNLTKQLDLFDQAVKKGAQILCTQELFLSPYFCQTEEHRFFELAETIPGPTTEKLCSFAKDKEVVIVAGLFERRSAGVYHNSAVVIDADGKLLGTYRKMHIPDDPQYYEKFYFSPGDLGFRAWQTRYAKIGVLICWDQWFPEGARLTALQGAEILFYPTAIGWLPPEKAEYGKSQHEAWELVQRSHAVTNGCFVCVPNRIGLEKIQDGKGIEFWGQSFVAAPNGQVLERASQDKDQVLVVECDLSRVEFSRTHWPFLRDRRVDVYQDLSKRFIDNDKA